ncbi:MAG: hypothetical protein V4514_09535 [Pseudomonadota bacterium]|uniref:hypothetical protein n=1 Tax=unclassified Phenylobacterium TaxID=2640670 RepID=UPI0006FDABD2|nr:MULTISPECIES: hypothetical protein [unclassified Phenylobacterium]KRB44350.1 hypothetical protein ASE02_01475 [Phenylobacterium sp. Root700]MBT9472383.1 hypothetical protein [Phenylobacterium sp.]
MIGVGRSAQIIGDPQAAMAFAASMTEHIKGWPGVQRATCWASLAGATGTVAWWLEMTDLAAFEALNTAIASDKTYWAKVTEARDKGYFAPQSFHDNLMRQVA